MNERVGEEGRERLQDAQVLSGPLALLGDGVESDEAELLAAPVEREDREREDALGREDLLLVRPSFGDLLEVEEHELPFLAKCLEPPACHLERDLLELRDLGLDADRTPLVCVRHLRGSLVETEDVGAVDAEQGGDPAEAGFDLFRERLCVGEQEALCGRVKGALERDALPERLFDSDAGSDVVQRLDGAEERAALVAESAGAREHVRPTPFVHPGEVKLRDEGVAVPRRIVAALDGVLSVRDDVDQRGATLAVEDLGVRVIASSKHRVGADAAQPLDRRVPRDDSMVRVERECRRGKQGEGGAEGLGRALPQTFEDRGGTVRAALRALARSLRRSFGVVNHGISGRRENLRPAPGSIIGRGSGMCSR